VTHALDKWLLPYLAQSLRPRPRPREGMVLCVAIANHFEPFAGGADQELAELRLNAWEEGLARLAEEVADHRGQPLVHTLFYPLEDYRPWVLDRLARLQERGLAEVEVHLHHQGESSAELEDRLTSYVETLHRRHGLLRRDPATGRLAYGFVHGNWALDNALPDGRWCGVNDEISILARTGCYADFTYPAAPSPAQVRTINAIYYVKDDPARPRSHEFGRPARVGSPPWGDLLLVQGVLALNWRWRKWGLLPRLEDSDLGAHRPLREDRLPLWLRYAPAVEGAEGVRFLKLHCHGALRRHHPALLGETARRFWHRLVEGGLGAMRLRIYFMSCWEMVHTIHALERGEEIG